MRYHLSGIGKDQPYDMRDAWSAVEKMKSDEAYRERLMGIAEGALISPSRLEKFMHGAGDLTREELL